MRVLAIIPVFALFSLQCSAKAEFAQPPLIDGKPAFLLPDFAIDRTLPNLGSEPTAKAPEKAKADDATHSAPRPKSRLAWRAVAPPDDIFLERAPGELQ